MRFFYRAILVYQYTDEMIADAPRSSPMSISPSSSPQNAPGILSRRRGFTLIELLLVIAIIGIVTTLTIPAANTILRGSQLTQSAQMINEKIGLARQTALSKNHSIEVRLYQFADPSVTGEQAGNAGTGKYRAIQTFEILESGSAVPLGKMQRIAPSIIIDSGGTLSSLLDAATTPALKKAWTPQDPKVSLPNIGINYNCCSFRFLPDGSTNLAPATGKWFFTMHNIRPGSSTGVDGLVDPPPNFFTIQIDATNGHIRTFRP
jgi:uncharacterized protein (TIGR02596 family)